MEKGNDPVNHPEHYTWHPRVECIEVTEHFDFLIGNAIKYLWRFKVTQSAEDLRKAHWYINRKCEEVIQRQAEEAVYQEFAPPEITEPVCVAGTSGYVDIPSVTRQITPDDPNFAKWKAEWDKYQNKMHAYWASDCLTGEDETEPLCVLCGGTEDDYRHQIDDNA